MVLVKDRSACLDQGSEKRGGVAEIKGIKMACPPREVRITPVQFASDRLGVIEFEYSLLAA